MYILISKAYRRGEAFTPHFKLLCPISKVERLLFSLCNNSGHTRPNCLEGQVREMATMTAKRSRAASGFTIIEIMAATVILMVAVLGTSAFRYTAALGARRADAQTAAARIGLLLTESWRGASDPNTFDPMPLADGEPGSALVIENSYVSLEAPAGFTVLGTYRITADDFGYDAVLSWKDVSGGGLRALNVIVAWDQRGSKSEYHSYPDKSFELTTYVTN